MARPNRPRTGVAAASGIPTPSMELVSGNLAGKVGAVGLSPSMVSSAAIYKPNRRTQPNEDRNTIAQPWQVEMYRHVNICGEARYAVTLFSSMAARAEIGVSEPQTIVRKAVWVQNGPEVDAFAELAPTVRERAKLIRDYMAHYIIAGESYLIARNRVSTDPGYISPPLDPATGTAYDSWETYTHAQIADVDLLDPEAERPNGDPNEPIWEIVAVTEIQKVGDTWRVRHDNNNYLDLSDDDPVIRLWNPDPENRREAWSPFRSMQTTLREIEWLTAHIFTQVRSRLMSAGIWFLPDNLTYPDPPADAVDGGAEAIAAMNDAERFMVSLAASSMSALDAEEVSFPSIVMADPLALAVVDKDKLIQFWSEIDDKAMVLRDSAIRRFGMGMDLPTGQAVDPGSLGSSSTGTSSGGSVNHWGKWAEQEQAISAHVEPALDIFCASLTGAYLRSVVEGTDKVLAYNTASLRLKQDRSKEALEWYDRGVLKAEVAVREGGFDPDTDMMDEKEHRMWLLNRLAAGSASPEQLQAAFQMLGITLPVEAPVSGNPASEAAPELPDGHTRSLKDHPYEGPPRVQHDHSEAPYAGFTAVQASCEALVLRALEKAGNRLLNDGKRGRDKDRSTPAHMAHIAAEGCQIPDFDFTLLPTVLGELPGTKQLAIGARLDALCTGLYEKNAPYTREGLVEALGAL